MPWLLYRVHVAFKIVFAPVQLDAHLCGIRLSAIAIYNFRLPGSLLLLWTFSAMNMVSVVTLTHWRRTQQPSIHRTELVGQRNEWCAPAMCCGVKIAFLVATQRESRWARDSLFRCEMCVCGVQLALLERGSSLREANIFLHSVFNSLT